VDAWHGIADAIAWVRSIIGDIEGGVNKLFQPVTDANDSMNVPWNAGGDWKKAAQGPLPKIIQSVIDAVRRFLFPPVSASGTPVAVTQAVGAWAPLVLQALAMLGMSPGLLGIILAQMATESGGNPNAINLWDSNAAAGHPSMGLMQVIGPTFESYRSPALPDNILDPLANIYAAINYARASYGPNLSALGQGHGYDSGGWLPPGISTVVNQTGSPEAVFSPQQWKTLEANLHNTGQQKVVGDVNVYTYMNASDAHIQAKVDRRIDLATRLGVAQ
jgi:SLT domain-containing protein